MNKGVDTNALSTIISLIPFHHHSLFSSFYRYLASVLDSLNQTSSLPMPYIAMAVVNQQDYMFVVSESEIIQTKFVALEMENQRLLQDLQKVTGKTTIT